MTFFKIFIISLIALASWISIAPAQQENSEGKNYSDSSIEFQPAEETAFDRKLPQTQRKREIEISFNPRFTDAIDQEFIRYRTRAKYGFTDRLEMSLSLESFSVNPFRSKGESGVSELIAWGKYRFPDWSRLPGFRISTGLETVFPIGNPPEEISDQYLHIRPFLVFSRFLRSLPNLEVFYYVDFDLTAHPPFRARPAQDRRDHSVGVSIGGVYYWSKNLRSSLDLTYITTEIGGGSENNVILNNGLFWTIPKSYFGKWGLGAGVRIPLTREDENFTFITKVKWDFNLKWKIPLDSKSNSPKQRKENTNQ